MKSAALQDAVARAAAPNDGVVSAGVNVNERAMIFLFVSFSNGTFLRIAVRESEEGTRRRGAVGRTARASGRAGQRRFGQQGVLSWSTEAQLLAPRVLVWGLEGGGVKGELWKDTVRNFMRERYRTSTHTSVAGVQKEKIFRHATISLTQTRRILVSSSHSIKQD